MTIQLNEKYSSMSKDGKFDAEERIRRIRGDLLNTYNGCSERAIRSLYFLNAGGVIAIITYITTQSKKNFFISAALVIFLIGLFFAFMLTTIDYLLIYTRCYTFYSDVGEFYNDKKLFCDFDSIKKPGDIKKFGFIIIGIGIVSGLSAVAGIILGLFGYFN